MAASSSQFPYKPGFWVKDCCGRYALLNFLCFFIEIILFFCLLRNRFPCGFFYACLVSADSPLSLTHTYFPILPFCALSVPHNPPSTLFCYLSAPSRFPWTLYSFLAFIHVYSHQDTHTLNGQRLGAMYGRGCMVFVYLSLGCLG